MPRGEETQEVPQEEGREVSENTEAQRDQELILDPEAVVERERVIEESEAIEAAVVEAVEATPETEEGESVVIAEISQALDETSFKVESPAPNWEEEPPKPPQGTMEEGGTELEGEILSGTSYQVEDSVDFEEGFLEETSFKVESPGPEEGTLPAATPEPSISGEPDASQVGALPLPLPDPSTSGEPDGPEEGTLPVPPPEASIANEEEEPVQPGPASRDLISEEEEEGVQSGPGDQSLASEEEEEGVQPGPGDRGLVSEEEEEGVQPGPGDRGLVSEEEEEGVQPGPAGQRLVSEEEEEPIQPGPAGQRLVSEEEEEPVQPGTSDRVGQIEQGEILDETSFKFFTAQPDQQVDLAGEEVLDQTSFKFFTPQPGQVYEEADQEVFDNISFKFFTPQPSQGQIGTAEISSEQIDQILEGEAGEILDGEAFKPIPADQAETDLIPDATSGIAPLHQPSPTAAQSDGEISVAPLPLPSPESGQDPGDDDPGGSILIGTEGEGQGELEQLDLTAQAAQEVEAYWEPPDIYLHVNADGTRTIVDAAGNKVDSPPVYQIISDGAGVEHILAVYPAGGGKEQLFEIPFYSTPLQGMSVHIGPGGQMNVLDPFGNIIKSPPILTQVVDAAGKTHIYGEYPGIGPGQKVELSVFSQNIDPAQTFVYQGQDGQIRVVDSNGKELAVPPAVVNTFVDQKGMTRCIVSYLRPDDPSQEIKVELSYYESSQGEYFVHVDQNGVYSVVDSSGKPVDSPPLLTDKFVDENGVEHFTASYAGSGTEKQELSMYSSSIEDVYVHQGPGGTITVVDASGAAINSPPLITKNIGENGQTIYTASYPGGEEGAKSIQISDYIAPIKDMFASVGQDGTITVVDSDGKAVNSPPLIKSVTDSSGMVKIFASYPGEQAIELNFYQPPSAHWDKK